MAWETQRAAIVDRHPDLIVLSEAPADERLGQLATDLGAGTSYVGIFHDPRRPYWYRMVVCSRWPVRLEGRVPVPGGVAMSVTAEVRGRDYRLLVVDGVSSPSALPPALPRAPSPTLAESLRRAVGRTTASSATSTPQAAASALTSWRIRAINWRAVRLQVGARRSRPGSPSTTSITCGSALACESFPALSSTVHGRTIAARL